MHHQPGNVEINETLEIPLPILEQYCNVIIRGGTMKVNRIPFSMTISHHIKFSTAEVLENQDMDTILKVIKWINKVYGQRGFHI